MIITFYSYKGGVGRSMALVNVAEWLRCQGLRVIVVDWDLEAPGLESFFEADPDKRALMCDQRGIIDLLVSYRSAHASLNPLHVTVCEAAAGKENPSSSVDHARRGATDALSADQKLELLRSVLPSLAFSLQPLRDSGPPAPNGSTPGLWLLSAGARTGPRFAEYARHVHSFDWAGFYTAQDGDVFFRWLRQELESFAEIILIDSRTGVTEMSGVCTRDLADLVVSFCAPNDANLSGVVRMTRWFLEPDLPALRGDRPLRAMIIPSRIDHQSETFELNSFKSKFFAEVNALRELAPEVDATAWWDLQIRYVSRYSFHELIVVGREGENEQLQEDVETLAIELARRYIAQAGKQPGLLSGRQLRSQLRALLEESGIDLGLQAEEALARIPPPNRARCLTLLTRLIRLARPEEGGAITAIRAPHAAFVDSDRELLSILTSVGITRIMDDGGVPCVELADAAYAQKWQRLTELVRTDAEFLLWRQQLNGYLNDYRQHKEDPGALLAGGLLEEAKRYRQARATDLGPEELQYIGRSEAYAQESLHLKDQQLLVARQEVQKELAQSHQRDRRRIWVGLAAALVLGFAGITVLNVAETNKAAKVAGFQKAADTALARNDYLGAIDSFNEALELRPRDATLLLKRGTARVTASHLSGQGKLLNDGILDLQRAIEINPKQADAYSALAAALAQRRGPADEQNALANYTRAIELENSNATLYFERARFQDSLGHSEGALQDYKRVTQIDPQFVDAYFNAGLLLAAAGERGEASTNFREVVRRTNDVALAQAANTELEHLGEKQVSAPKATLFIHYTDARDASLVRAVAREISSAELDVATPALRPERVGGDVRYFFAEDQATAGKIRSQLEAALLQHGVRVPLETIYLDAKRFSGAARERLEAWLPPLAVRFSVDVLWCQPGGDLAQRQALTLQARAAKDPQWRNRWAVSPLQPDSEEASSYRTTSYLVRSNSSAERTAADDLASWIRSALGAGDIPVETSKNNRPGNLSVIVCPTSTGASAK